MAFEMRNVAVYNRQSIRYSIDEALLGPQFVDWVKKRIFLNENLRILSDYFEIRRSKLGLDGRALNGLKKRPWSLEGMMAVNEQKKYSGKKEDL